MLFLFYIHITGVFFSIFTRVLSFGHLFAGLGKEESSFIGGWELFRHEDIAIEVHEAKMQKKTLINFFENRVAEHTSVNMDN